MGTDSFTSTMIVVAIVFERFSADFSTWMWNFSFIERWINNFSAKTSVFSRSGFSYKLTSWTSPAAFFGSGWWVFWPFFDTMNVEDLEAFAITGKKYIINYYTTKISTKINVDYFLMPKFHNRKTELKKIIPKLFQV